MSDTNDVRERMEETARYVATILPPHTGFVILAFDFGPDGRMEYTSNSNREEVLKAMQEFVDVNRNPHNWMKHT